MRRLYRDAGYWVVEGNGESLLKTQITDKDGLHVTQERPTRKGIVERYKGARQIILRAVVALSVPE